MKYMNRFETYSRIGGDDRFKWIAESSLTEFDKLNPKVQKAREELSVFLSSCDDPENPPADYHMKYMELDPIEEARDQSCIIAVVFTAMYFEAFIYDYAASCVGDRYTKNHLDKLDFISKWVVVPRLVTGNEISKSGRAYESLKKLHKDRNSLVHLKSKKMNFNDSEMVAYLEDRENEIQDSVKNLSLIHI